MKKLILSNRQSPGDIVMLTAAVRDLHRSHPGKFATDVRTSGAALWENNPHIVPLRGVVPLRGAASLRDDDPDATRIECRYPLIHRSNSSPWHFIHGFTQFLAETLGVKITPTDFKGDIHLAPDERKWISQVQEITREPVPFWIVNAGGKFDFTAKWWEHARYQEVIDHFRGRILFVQVGENGHRHEPLRGVLDLRGRTSLRQLVRLVHHAQGVLCPVTLLMHLAAAVPVRADMPKNRPCVIIAGGREPAQCEAYPHHQFLHTNGALPCCDHGGCWKSRTVPLGDGDKKDAPEKLCTNVVHLRDSALSYVRRQEDPVPAHAAADAPGRNAEDFLPRCLDLITAEEVIRRISLYFDGGAVRALTAKQWQICGETIAGLEE